MQLVQLQEVYPEFEALDTVVIAIAQEDKDLESHGRMLKSFDPQPSFKVVADIDRQATQRYDRTTAYLIDKKGIVRQVFPMMIHYRPSWHAVLKEVKKLESE